jgi:hypothetical protein
MGPTARGLSSQERDRAERLERAAAHIFATGLGDSGSALCLANMKYGLAKIHCVQERLGLRPDATFIGTPDMTVSRNVARWTNGIGYGGKLVWGSGEDELIILDTKPNACGMFVGGLSSAPDAARVIERAQGLKSQNLQIDGVPINWDFSTSNHFIDLFRVESVVDGRPDGSLPHEDLPEFAFISHFAGEELRGVTDKGRGLYYDASPALMETAEVVATPFGPCRILTGQQAREYYAFYQYVDRFSKQKRLLAAQNLFDDAVPLANETHQGLLSMNELVLGCHPVPAESQSALLPLTLRADLPAYLVRGLPNLSPERVETLGFRQRAMDLGVHDRLTQANVVPHGGGYVFDDLLDVIAVHEVDGKRFFELGLHHGYGRQLIDHARHLPYRYRGREVALRAFELGLAQPVARLAPIQIMKV